VPDDNRDSTLDDARFVIGDIFQFFAQHARMVIMHRADHAHTRGDDIGRVVAPAHPHFNHADPAVFIGKVAQGQAQPGFRIVGIAQAGIIGL
jgi:hypothetical protein